MSPEWQANAKGNEGSSGPGTSARPRNGNEALSTGQAGTRQV